MTTSKEPLQTIFNNMYKAFDATRVMNFLESEFRLEIRREVNKKTDTSIRGEIYPIVAEYSVFDIIDGDIFNDKG